MRVMLKVLWLLSLGTVFGAAMWILVQALQKRFQDLNLSMFTNIRRQLEQPIISVMGLVLVAFLYLPSSQHTLLKYRNLDAIFIAAGGMIGTIIALIFSLSIIVVQRAAETFTPFVSRLYREDRKTHFIFVVLVALCLFSFLLSVDGILFGLSQTKLIPVEVLMIAATSEMSRLQYRRVSRLNFELCLECCVNGDGGWGEDTDLPRLNVSAN